MRLLLATSNPAKVERLQWIVRGFPLHCVVAGREGPNVEVEEGADSAVANASAKAAAGARLYGLPSLATDGGLHVPALGDRWNPYRVRRAAGAHVTDRDRAAHVLGLARDLHGTERTARFEEVVALARPDGTIAGAWTGWSDDVVLADTFDDTQLPPGFWVPGVLLFGCERRRWSALATAEREQGGRQWEELYGPVREGVRALMAEAEASA